MGPFGKTFAPVADASGESRDGAPTGGRARGQQAAIKTISLQLPRVVGSRAPVANALLQPQAMAPTGLTPNSALWGAVLRALGLEGTEMPALGSLGLGAIGGPPPTTISIHDNPGVGRTGVGPVQPPTAGPQMGPFTTPTSEPASEYRRSKEIYGDVADQYFAPGAGGRPF